MKKVSFLLLLGILTFLVNSCSYMSSFAKKRKEVEPVSNSPTVVKVTAGGKAKKIEQEKSTKEKEKELEANSRQENVIGLIPATKPDIRVKTSVRGRTDPFSVVPLQPKLEIEIAEKEEDKITNPRNITKIPTLESSKQPSSLGSSKQPSTTKDLDPSKNVNTPPQEYLSDNVLITGLVELGSSTRIIIESPEESSSRHVGIGQYISNGKVLVKRIESSFPTPVVILEEGGIEITKTIGTLPDEKEKNNITFIQPRNSPESWLSEYLSDKSDFE